MQLHLARRPAEALLAVCHVSWADASARRPLSLTPLAEDYLLESSPTYFGGELDLTIANASVYSFESLRRPCCTDVPQIYGSGDLFKSHEEQAELARAFTRGMHSIEHGSCSGVAGSA